MSNVPSVPNLLGNGTPNWGSVGSGTTGYGQAGPNYLRAPSDGPTEGDTGNPLSPMWGGGYGLANANANDLSQLANQVGNRPMQDLSSMGGTYGDPNADAAQAAAARQQQLSSLGMLANTAQGNGPSAATMQMGAALGGSDLANAYAASQMGGAGNSAAALRGLGGANMNAVGQGAAGRMGEIQAAQGAYLGAANELTGSDLEQQKLATQLGNAQAQANLATEQGNWQAQVAYQNMANQTLEQQAQASQQYADVLAGNTAQLGVVNYQNQQAFNNAQMAGGFNAAGSLAGLATQGMNQPESTASPTEADLENPYAGGDYGSGSYGGGAVEG